MERWHNKIAVVTGASAGIGAAIAEKLVEEGLNVVGLARRYEQVEKLAQRLKGKNGSKLHPIKADMTKEEDIVRAFKWIEDNLGPIHILINNAGVARNTTLVNGDVNEWKKVLDTNVLGVTIASKEAIKSMMAHNVDGHIININSVAGHFVPRLPAVNVYCASKFAVTALTETLRLELLSLGSKIKVTSVSPGYVETEIVAANGFLTNPTIMQIEKLAPRMYPKDIADAVAYVLGTPPHVQVTELTIRPLGEPA